MSNMYKSVLTNSTGSKRGSSAASRGRSTRGGHQIQSQLGQPATAGSFSHGPSSGISTNVRGGRGRGSNLSQFGKQPRNNVQAAGGVKGGFTGFRKTSTPANSQVTSPPASNPFGPKSEVKASPGFGGATRSQEEAHPLFGQGCGGRGGVRGVGIVDQSRDPRRRQETTAPKTQTTDSIAIYTTRYEQLKQARAGLRAEAIRNGMMIDPDQPTSLNKAITPTGKCMEMCPEFERVERIVQKMVDKCERQIDPASGISSSMEGKMIKRFRRSAAGKDEQLPSDIRSPETLLQTINYMLRYVTTSDDKLGSIHKFVWDRTRSVRNDLSIQQVSQRHDIEVAVKCFERIARFHILSLHLLSNPSNQEQFDHHQDREQLNNTLLSLLYYYDDNRGRIVFPNEPEFRAYYILFSIHDQRPDLEARVQRWPRELRESPRVQVAMELFAAAGNTWEYQGTLDAKRPNSLAQGFYSRFFRKVRSKNVSYLMACVAEVYFNQVRQTAIRSIWKAYCRQPASQQHKNLEWTIDQLTIALAFDDKDQTIAFCEEQDLQLATNPEGMLYLNWADRPLDSVSFQPSSRQTFSYCLVERKRCGRSLAAVILGMSVSQATRLKMIDVSLLKSDQIDLATQTEEEGLFCSDDEKQQEPASLPQPSPFRILNNPTVLAAEPAPSFGGPVSQLGQSSLFGSPVKSGPSPIASPFAPQGSTVEPITQFGQPSPAQISTSLPLSSKPSPFISDTEDKSSETMANPPTFLPSFPANAQAGFGLLGASTPSSFNQPPKEKQSMPVTSIFGPSSSNATSTRDATETNTEAVKPSLLSLGQSSPFASSSISRNMGEITNPFSMGETKKEIAVSSASNLPKQPPRSLFSVFPGNTFGHQPTVFGQQSISALPQPKSSESPPDEQASQAKQQEPLPTQSPTGLQSRSVPFFDSTGDNSQSKSTQVLSTHPHFKISGIGQTPEAQDNQDNFSFPTGTNGFFELGAFQQQRLQQKVKEDAIKERNEKNEKEKIRAEEVKALEEEERRSRQREKEKEDAEKRELERQEAAAREAAREALRKKEAKEEAKRQAEARERAQHELEEELQAAQRDIARIQAAEQRATRREAARRASIEADIVKRKADDITQNAEPPHKRPPKAVRLTPEDELSIEELMKVGKPRHKRSHTFKPELIKPLIDQDELLLSAARLAAHTLSQGGRLWDETTTDFSQSVSSASSSFFGRSSIGSRPSFDGSHAQVNGYNVALAPSSPLGLGRTLSRTEQRIRATGAKGLAFKPIKNTAAERSKSKEKEPRR